MGLRSGPCFPLFCLAEQTAPCRQAGRERKRGDEDWGSVQGTGTLPGAGWVAWTPGVQREPFFVLCHQNGGSCCCLGASARPRVRLYRIPNLSTTSLLISHMTAVILSPSPSHTSPSIHPSIPSARSAGGAQCFFVDAQETKQTSSQRKRGLLIVSVARQKRFLLPLRRSL